jgi:serine phosphatase RsbU (regulator of sigma subunit)
MKLATKLMIAFFLLAVLPLSWITLYSYNSAIRAFRRAVEAESVTLTEDMGGRMQSVRRELALRVDRLSQFPFQQLMALKDEKVDAKSNPLMAELMAELGDAAPLMDSIEFNLAGNRTPGTGSPDAKPQPPAAPPTSAGTASEAPHSLVIHLSPETPAPPAGSRPAAAEPQQQGYAMHIRPKINPKAAEEVLRASAEAGKKKADIQLRQIQEFQVYLEKMGASAERMKATAGAMAAAESAAKPAPPAAGPGRANPPAGNFSSVVRRDGRSIGTVRARISSPQLYRDILSRSRRREGEIPFIVDADKKLHTVRPADQKRLEGLNLPAAMDTSSAGNTAPQLKDWVVVTRKDEDSNLTFGIARPISEPLRDMRNTAARNLGYGLGMIGLALIAIIPFSNRITHNLAALTQGAEKLAHGDLQARVTIRSKDEIGRLAESFNRMAHDLSENQKHLLEQERLRKELEMSRRIQEELLPKQPLHSGPVDAKGVSIPAREVGGDFFNYFPLSNGEIAILVGDVSGKGVAAALLMANLQATLQARLPLVPDLAQLASQLDREIEAMTPKEVYLTLFMAILNHQERRLRYVNAGHNPQFALHSQGRLERLESTGRPLGLLPGGGFVERSIVMAGGDALFLYTDGLVEAEDSDGREFGQQRLEQILVEAGTGGINETLATIENAVRSHRGSVEAADDATMLFLKIGGQDSGAESPRQRV